MPVEEALEIVQAKLSPEALPQKSGRATPCRLRRLSPFVRGRIQSLILLVLLSPLQRGTAAVGGRGSLCRTFEAKPEKRGLKHIGNLLRRYRKVSSAYRPEEEGLKEWGCFGADSVYGTPF